MMKVEKIDLTNLPSDVASNIASFVVGNPEYVRLKHNKALKKMIRKNITPQYTNEDRELSIYDEDVYTKGEHSEITCQYNEISYEIMEGKFGRKTYRLIQHLDKQHEKIKNIIDREMKDLQQKGTIRSLKIFLIRNYKSGYYFNPDGNKLQRYKIKNLDDIDNELHRIIREINYTEVDFQIDYRDDDTEISSYFLKVEFNTKLFEIIDA